jgi:hypothetical protein
MRLTPDQAAAIYSGIRLQIAARARIWLFGPRVDNRRCGGNISLFMEPASPPTLKDRLRSKVALTDALDDLVAQKPTRRSTASAGAIKRRYD